MDDRYSRQILFSGLGEVGQKRLGRSSAVIIGCGGLGSTIATTLVRAGVGKVKIIDKDVLEYHNLHRQVLYDEDDVRSKLPKAVAAQRHLKKINSSVEVRGVAAEVDHTNIEKLVRGADVILDGLNDFKTRLLINDVALKCQTPWVYGGAVASLGMTMTIIPGKTPCFRCRFPAGESEGVFTSSTAGILGPTPFVIGSLEAAEAIKILVGAEELNRDLICIDVWQGTFKRLKLSPRKDCPPCGGKYEFLDAKHR